MRNSPFADPRFQKAFRNLQQAVALQNQGRYDLADRAFAAVVKKNPDYFDALHLYGLFKYQRGVFDQALQLVSRAIKANPRSANALNSRGMILAELGQHAEALDSFDAAIRLDLNNVYALSNRCNSLNELERYQDAIDSSDRVLAIDRSYSEVYIPRGAALLNCKRYDEALECYDTAVALNHNLAAVALLGRGNVFTDRQRNDEASAAFSKALALNPNLSGAWLGQGFVFFNLGKYENALASFDRSIAIKPDSIAARGGRLAAKMYLADWKDFKSECEVLVSSIRGLRESVLPFTLLGICSSPESQLRCAKQWTAKTAPASSDPVWRNERYNHARVRVAYLSGDFREHPVAHLTAGVFEQHDRQRFETVAISFRSDDASEMQTRLKGAFDRFIDVAADSDAEVAKLLRDLEIDIAVDLMGYTQDARTNIFAMRPAPIQVNYLGFSGTMGADYIDYLIADRRVVTLGQEKHYTENIVYLPNSFMPYDSRRVISDRTPDRSEFGLPQKGTIFCCFNNIYKLSPDIFGSWMKILKAVEQGVLWLSEPNATAADNLKKETAARGIDPERLIFAKRLPLISDHLARHRLADLFLDTLPYNAHTTAADALWSGLPVLTQIGETFAGRVAASLLNALGLPEMITETRAQYEAAAIDLAAHSEKLVAIRAKLAQSRLASPLFDTRRYTRDLEAAYALMHERYKAGLPPADLEVPNFAM
jgi:protein O-GlcNAc transferase